MIGAGPTWVVPLGEADPENRDRLGGKGASLATLARLGLPVPPAFVVPTELSRHYLTSGELPDDCWAAVDAAVAGIEAEAGRRFGNVDRPMLVSVRSGAPVSMPGMLDTILNIGLTEATLPGLARLTGDAAFAWDSYCRLLKMFGSSVRGSSRAALAAAGRATTAPTGSREDHLRAVARRLLEVIEAESGRPFPQDPWEQLREAVEAVVRSWDSRRARRYRAHAGIDDRLGTAVIVQAMVFGNLDDSSGSGVAFTRDPATGTPGLYGDFLSRAQGEDVVSGEFDVASLEECRRVAPEAYGRLEASAAVLEGHYRDMCDIEFTVERGRLWVLQVRPGQRTGVAEVRIAGDMVGEGAIDLTTAIERISPGGLLSIRAPVLADDARGEPQGCGTPASPGAAVGVVATSSRRAEELAAEGQDVILVRVETSPDDIAGFIAARGIVTARGGRASHAAVVARGMNRPAVCSVAGLVVNDGEIEIGGVTVREGEPISIDGSRGTVFTGRLPLAAPARDARVERLLEHCDERRRVPVLPESSADGGEAGDELLVCASASELESAARAGAERLLIEVAAADDPVALLERAAALDPAPAELFVRVTGDWPHAVRRLPPLPLSALIADERGYPAARLLAATAANSKVEPSTS